MLFNCFNSSSGRPGNALLPSGVHLLSTSSPKIASLADFWASVPALASVLSFACFWSTASTVLNLSFCIEDDGKSLPHAVTMGSDSGTSPVC